jgi:TPR repeat protein
VALSGFQRFETAHLKVKRGDVVTVLNDLGDGWYEGEIKGRRGIFPRHKLTELPALMAEVAKCEPTAQLELGVRLAFGSGMPKDPIEAARYYSLAAAQGLSRAYFNLGMSCRRGDGRKQNVRKIVSHYLSYHLLMFF